MFLTYEEYQDRGGALDSVAFNNAYIKAITLINSYTFGRLKSTQPNEVIKGLIFELINSYNDEEMSKVQSQSNDGFSVSFKTDTNYTTLRETTIREFLSTETDNNGIPLLYCGVG